MSPSRRLLSSSKRRISTYPFGFNKGLTSRLRPPPGADGLYTFLLAPGGGKAHASSIAPGNTQAKAFFPQQDRVNNIISFSLQEWPSLAKSRSYLQERAKPTLPFSFNKGRSSRFPPPRARSGWSPRYFPRSRRRTSSSPLSNAIRGESPHLLLRSRRGKTSWWSTSP